MSAVSLVPAVPPVDRVEGVRLSRVQYHRLADVLDSLSPTEWAAPTDCAGWDVKAVASHVLGGLECLVSRREFVRQLLAGRRLGYPDPLDGLNEYQVRLYAPLPSSVVAARLRSLVDPALKARLRTPRALRSLVRPSMAVSGRVSLGWIFDVIYTRDTFMHRIDVCRATGRDVVTDQIEARIVADIVGEWADRHGAPVTLRITGPAGGTYVAGSGGEEIECDAIEFARLVSGRGTPVGLLATSVQY